MNPYPRLTITLLDVGWGDAIFLESIDVNGDYHFGLIDSNDTKNTTTSYHYLKRYFRRHRYYVTHKDLVPPCFDFVLLTHDHADHRSGLKQIIRKFGCRDFWYPKSKASHDLTGFLRYAEMEMHKPDGTINHHEALNSDKPLADFGDVQMEILWPPADYIFDSNSVNNSSVVLKLSLGKWSAVLTGDAEEEVWEQISTTIPGNTRFFKVPHHGSINGTDPTSPTSWYRNCPRYARLGLSCDLRSSIQIFPSAEVIHKFDSDKRKYYRTDFHHHVSFVTDGEKYKIIYSH